MSEDIRLAHERAAGRTDICYNCKHRSHWSGSISSFCVYNPPVISPALATDPTADTGIWPQVRPTSRCSKFAAGNK